MSRKRKNGSIPWTGLILAGIGGLAVWLWRKQQTTEGPERGLGIPETGEGTLPATTDVPVGSQRQPTTAELEVQILLNEITGIGLPQAAAVAYQIKVRGLSASALRGYSPPVVSQLELWAPLREDGMIGTLTRERYVQLRTLCNSAGIALSVSSTDTPANQVQALTSLRDRFNNALDDAEEGNCSASLLKIGEKWLRLAGCWGTSSRMECNFLLNPQS